MIPMPANINDALDIEPLVRDIYASWLKLSPDHRVQETLSGTDFYASMVRCREIIAMLDAYRQELDVIGIDNRFGD